MDTAITLALTAAWIALGVLLAYGVYDAWRRVEPLPFFQVLERRGLSVAQAEEAAGREALAIGAVLATCASMLHQRGILRERGARILNYAGYGFMGVSMLLFVLAGLLGVPG